METVISILFLLSFLISFSQEKITKYYKEDSIVDKMYATKYSTEYFDTKKNRIYKEFYKIDDNTLIKRAYYLNDSTMDGLLVNYIKNNQVWDSGYMKKGCRDGVSYFFHNNGKLASVIDFKRSTSLFLKCFNENGDSIICDKEIEVMPMFPGGADALMLYLKTMINYPKDARKNNITGKVIVKFFIDTDGSVKGAKIVKSVSKSLDEEALRVINIMPNWEAGAQYNRKVKVYYVLPINFKLQ